MSDRENLSPATQYTDMREAIRLLGTGRPLVVSMRRTSGHHHLIRWAERQGLFVRIDRTSVWGNPFILGRDGNRTTVIRAYAENHLPQRTDLLAGLSAGELAGKVLGCWCHPERCHGHILAALTLDPELTPRQALDLIGTP